VEGGLRNLGACVVVAAATVFAVGCGDDSNDGSGDAKYTVEIVRADFPKFQRLAEQSTFEIAVRNAGNDPIPDLAVTVHGFGERSADAPGRSLWVIDVPPTGVTASTDTWTTGRVEPGATATLRWVVTPIEPGNKTLSYDVAADLKGDVRAALANGTTPHGAIAVRVTDKAPKARVDPRTGEVIRDKTRAGG
jgi:hypothetical protein